MGEGRSCVGGRLGFPTLKLVWHCVPHVHGLKTRATSGEFHFEISCGGVAGSEVGFAGGGGDEDYFAGFGGNCNFVGMDGEGSFSCDEDRWFFRAEVAHFTWLQLRAVEVEEW